MVGTAVGILPIVVAIAYVGLSFLSYLMYWLDKEAAQGGARRIPESTLHLVDLLGGWPGALIAQQQFRHKTVKASFRFAFWCRRSEERRAGKECVSMGRFWGSTYLYKKKK